MPDQPTWLQRVPDIRTTLEDPNAPPYLDRAAIERLFGLSRRQSIRILALCGGFQAGRTFLVSRESLLEYLNSRVRGDKVEFAVRRKTRILDQLNEARRRVSSARITLNVPAPAGNPALPEGVELFPGLLQVHFSSPVELLEKLFALARTVSNDYEAFETAASKP